MKLRKLLLCGVCALSATFAFAQNQTFPFTLTTADGLPEQADGKAVRVDFKVFNNVARSITNFIFPYHKKL